MPKQQLRITCDVCKKRRIKAKLPNGRKTTKRLCSSCYKNDKVSVFFGSSAGDWFAKRAIEHCTNSIPPNTDELIRLVNLYKTATKAKGYSYESGEFKTLYDYELCHKDPCKGDGYTGALVADNLIISLKSINRKMGNKEPITNFGHRIEQRGDEIMSSNVRSICSAKYDLERVVNECKLLRKSIEPPKDFKSYTCIEPSRLFNIIIDGYGWDTTGYLLPDELIEEAFEMLHDMPRVFCWSFLVQHGKIYSDF